MSSSDNVGSSFDSGGSNIGTCRSRSSRSVARALTSIFSMTGSMRGAVVFGFARTLLTISWRCCFARRPSSQMRASVEPDVERRDARDTRRVPMRSMIATHDTPVASDTAASHSTSSSTVVPSRPEPVLEAVADELAQDAAGRLPHVGVD